MPESSTPPDRATHAGRKSLGAGRRLVFRVVTVVGFAIAAFVLTEGVVRALGVQPIAIRAKRTLRDLTDPSHEFNLYPSNPHRAFVPTPDVASGRWSLLDLRYPPQPVPLERIGETPWAVEYRFTRLLGQRFRDQPLAPQPPPGVVRIAGVGDSFAFGEGVPTGETLFDVLERSLGKGYEVLNAGESGAHLAMEVGKVPWLAANAGCSRIVLVLIVNDIELSDALSGRIATINDFINVRDDLLAEHAAQTWWGGGSRLVQLVGAQMEMRRVARDTTQWYLDSFDRAHNAENLDRMAADFARVAAVPQCRVAVVLFPLMDRLESDYPLQPAHDTMAQLARDAGLPVLDLAPAFAGQDTESLWVHPVDHHPNAKAHAIAARAVDAWLRADVPGFLEDAE